MAHLKPTPYQSWGQVSRPTSAGALSELGPGLQTDLRRRPIRVGARSSDRPPPAPYQSWGQVSRPAPARALSELGPGLQTGPCPRPIRVWARSPDRPLPAPYQSWGQVSRPAPTRAVQGANVPGPREAGHTPSSCRAGRWSQALALKPRSDRAPLPGSAGDSTRRHGRVRRPCTGADPTSASESPALPGRGPADPAASAGFAWKVPPLRGTIGDGGAGRAQPQAR